MASTGHSTVEKVDTAAPGAAPWSNEEEEGAGQYFGGQGGWIYSSLLK